MDGHARRRISSAEKAVRMLLDRDGYALQRAIAHRRVRLAKKMSRILLGANVGQLPMTYMRSVLEHLYAPDISAHVAGYSVRSAPVVETYDFPADYPPEFHRCKAFDQRLCYELRDVIVSPSTGLIWFADGPILQESFGSVARAMHWQDIRVERMQRHRVLQFDGPLVPLASQSNAFYHWLIEALPAAIDGLAANPSAALLVSTDCPARVSEAAVELVGPDRVVRASGPVRVERLTLAGMDSYAGFAQARDIDQLRRTFPTPVDQRQAEWLYISRLRDPRRAMSNEAAIEDFVTRHGFRVVYLQDLSFAEQRATLAAASVVVAPHGAGLANLVWCAPGTHVVEIFPAGFFNDCYARLSLNLGLHYNYMMIESSQPKDYGVRRWP